VVDVRTRCAGPLCLRDVEPRATGRPARYCSATCRQAAHRDRVRQAEAAADIARRLESARAAAAVAFPQIDMYAGHAEMSAREVAGLAAAGADRAALAAALGELHRAASALERVTRDYRAAADLAAALSG
jgi:predicted ATPase with chaperone activity